MAMTSLSSAPPYNITTGFDDNHDTAINDRPAGAGRNSARIAAQFDLLARVAWGFGFGKAPGPQTGVPNIKRITSDGQRDPPGAVSSALGGQAHRCRVEVFVHAYNALNRVNRIGFRGVFTSPFYGTATVSLPPRRLEIGTRFDFQAVRFVSAATECRRSYQGPLLRTSLVSTPNLEGSGPGITRSFPTCAPSRPPGRRRQIRRVGRRRQATAA
jgi:hypothetical protein